MRKSSTKTSREPSKASLRDMPEVDLARYRVLGRGRHVALAQQSFESVVLDRLTVDLLGGPDGVREILDTVAKRVRGSRKKPQAA